MDNAEWVLLLVLGSSNQQCMQLQNPLSGKKPPLDTVNNHPL